MVAIKLEDKNLDYKEKIDESFGKILCSYANTDGGTIVIGVSKDGKVSGATQQDEENATNNAENCKPPVKFTSKWEEKDGKNVLTIDVPKSDRIHTWKGIAYKRAGSSSFPMSVEEIVELSRRRGDIKFDEEICEGAAIEDIDEEKVRWFLRRARARRNYPLDENTPVDKVLIHLNLLRNGKLTNAAVLLFGKNPQRFHIQAEVKCLQLAGTEIAKPFPSYHIYNGNLFEQIDKAIEFVLGSIKFSVPRPIGGREFEIPEFVIQEAIVNAVAHRDYHSNAGVQVMVFTDRIEIWNPGALPSYLTVESLKKPHTSYPRNPLLAEHLYLTEYIQKAGSGTIEMVKQCKKKGLPEPEFIQEMGQFIIKIWRDIFTESYLLGLGLNERQMKAVMYVKENGWIANRIHKGMFNITDRMALMDLSGLCEKKIFKRIGKTGRKTRYILEINPK